MRVVVIGGSGNVGSAVVRALSEEPTVTSIVGVARRRPNWQPAKTVWAKADVTTGDLTPIVAGADAVVHLAWVFQPTHDPYQTWQTNAIGTSRVLDAVASAQVKVFVYASSVGTYSPRHDSEPVAETWPTHGWPMAAYGREKAYAERMIDAFAADGPDRRVVRMRPAFTFQTPAATQQSRLFAGPLLPKRLVRQELIPVLPWPRGLEFQAVHADDLAAAYVRAVLEPVHGAFNVAADPVVTGPLLAEILGARLRTVPPGMVRRLLATGWHARLVPSTPELFEMARRLPVMDTRRARRSLAWSPRYSALEAVKTFLEGLRHSATGPTPPLADHCIRPGGASCAQ